MDVTITKINVSPHARMRLAQGVSLYFCDILELCETGVWHTVLPTIIHSERNIDVSMG